MDGCHFGGDMILEDGVFMGPHQTHYGLDKITPIERHIQKKPPGTGKIVKFPKVGGLHQRYEWKKTA